MCHQTLNWWRSSSCESFHLFSTAIFVLAHIVINPLSSPVYVLTNLIAASLFLYHQDNFGSPTHVPFDVWFHPSTLYGTSGPHTRHRYFIQDNKTSYRTSGPHMGHQDLIQDIRTSIPTFLFFPSFSSHSFQLFLPPLHLSIHPHLSFTNPYRM